MCDLCQAMIFAIVVLVIVEFDHCTLNLPHVYVLNLMSLAMVVLVNSISWIRFYSLCCIIGLIFSRYSIIIIWSNIAMATITFILIFYSISIRVIIIYRLIQELGSIRLILGIAIGLHLPLQVIVAYKIGIPPIHYWLVILVKYFHNTHLFWWLITLHKLWTIFLYVNCRLYILEIRFMILVWSIVLVFSSNSVIELIVYSSSFVVIGFILSSLLSIELTRLSVLLNSITIWVLFYKYCINYYLINFIVLLIRMPICFIFYVKYYVLNIFQATIPILMANLYASMTVYFIYCYYRLYLLTLTSGCIPPHRYDIVYSSDSKTI